MGTEADSVNRMVCYEIALQPRPQDDADFYLAAVMSSLLLPQPQGTDPSSAAGLSRSLSYASFRLHLMSHFATCQRKHTKLLSCIRSSQSSPAFLCCSGSMVASRGAVRCFSERISVEVDWSLSAGFDHQQQEELGPLISIKRCVLYKSCEL